MMETEKKKHKVTVDKVIIGCRDSLESHLGDWSPDEIGKQIKNIDDLIELEKKLEYRARLVKIRLPEVDPRIGAAIISGVCGLGVAGISYRFGRKLVKFEDDGGIVNLRHLGFGPKFPPARV